jgi:type I restriction enzyme M protein
VGKIPNPQSQVEQITTGLIYKFMDDMDQESIEMGGEGSFFVGDYEKYAWKNLLDPKLSGVDKVNLYSQAIEGMYLNPSAPQLFRDIFKNAFLPFKDPSTLNMFLKEINEFHYSHSEKLGDAFEYLISIMGSQGDAGQFRTPRHIIDFIVEIIDPQKNETILDPACGTAGFLISSYKHILKTNTDKKLGDKLSAEDKKRAGENVTGYDISPEMIRLSLVNMYLHGFSTPKIDEYDTLSSEDKWNEYFDVILANPPFFSPKGGIQPHKRFGVESKKAEVLFTSYILEHLKPNGRAGIIIPEGIIFQTGKAYKELRKQLIENALIGVISLPAGVFNPYAGVKTSILILDKKLNKERDFIFFAEVKNDGFNLGAQRTALDTSDLPKLSKDIVELSQNDLIEHVKKQKLLENKDFSLTLSRYIEAPILTGIYDFVPLSEVSSISNGYAFKSKEMHDEPNTGDLPVLKIGNITMDGNISEESIQYHKVENNLEKFLVSSEDIVIAMTGATVGKVAEIKAGKYLLNQRVGCLRSNNKINRNYLRFFLISDRFYNFCQIGADGGAQGNISSSDLEEFKIPLPTLEVQQEIVDELEGYQKIIDGCKQVVENYKPTIDIDPSWEMVDLGEICTLKTGGTPKSTKKEYYENGTIPWLVSGDIHKEEIFDCEGRITQEGLDSSNAKLLPKDSVMIALNGQGKTRGTVAILRFEATCNQSLVSILPSDEETLLVEYLFVCLSGMYKAIRNLTGDNQRSGLNMPIIKGIKIPLAPISIQKEIVQKVREERKVIEGNKKLIEIYTQKIQDRINKVWGEE